MPNKKGGKKFKRGKKTHIEKRLIYKNEEDGVEDQEYGMVKKINGSGRYQVYCFDGTERLGIMAGKIRKQVRIQLNDVVLLSLWNFQDNKCSIIHKYNESEVYKLKNENQFPEGIQLGEVNEYENNNKKNDICDYSHLEDIKS